MPLTERELYLHQLYLASCRGIAPGFIRPFCIRNVTRKIFNLMTYTYTYDMRMIYTYDNCIYTCINISKCILI